MVISQSLYRVLREKEPERIIDVLAPAWSRPLLNAMPEVSSALAMPLGHGELGLLQRYRLGSFLRSRKYDQAIVLPNSFKSALVPVFAAIPRRTGWRGEFRYGLLNDLRHPRDAELTTLAQRYAALGSAASEPLPEALPMPRLKVDEQRQVNVREHFGLDGAPLLALCPGAGFGSAKRWPAAHYGALARRYLDRGWQIVLLGSASDKGCCEEAMRVAGGSVACHDLAGRSDLEDAIALIAKSQAVVSNDSGLMHVAAALERPLVALFGPTPCAYTPPLTTAARVLSSDLECAPCGQRECPLLHRRCLADRGVDEVDVALQELLRQ